MSSSSEENFDIDNVSGSDESDDYAPAPKKTVSYAKSAPKAVKPAKPKATTKATAKEPTKAKATKKKVLKDIDENADESMMMDVDNAPNDSDSDTAPVRNVKAPPKNDKTASETYQKLTQLEHILKRPDSYIGSVERITQVMWAYDSDTKRMVHREVKYVPGFFKIVDEILVNAADNKINDPNMDSLKVHIDVDEGTISVFNNGKGIPIETHSTEKIPIPEMIFGHLLTSSNYDDDEKKLTGGRNGYGAKLANIYSTEFTVETADKKTEQKYKQTWTDNMMKAGKAKITKNSKKEEFTRVTFKPDLKRFGMDSIDEDTVALLKRRVYDMAGTVKNVKVFLNDERLKIKNFKQYVEMYVNSATAEAADSSGGAAQTKPTVVYEQIHDRWEVAFAISEGSFQQVSFANSIATSKGGTHVNYIADQIAKNLITGITKKNKGATVKPTQVKNHMWIFVNALIENPTFDSQTKETLTLPSAKFGTKPQLTEDFLKKVAKTGIVDNVLNWAKFKADQQIKKTDGTKRNRLLGMTKLSDANNAGTRNASNCTLILTEGDSAKALAIGGLGVVGRDNFGVFPLRGKLLNVREAKHETIMKNEEIQNVKKILGLQHNKVYSDTSSLRYGRLMIMTDQDHDGSHIKGLLINFLDHFFPSLLKIPEFLVEFVTPIVRVTKGKQRIDFFTIPEFEQWQEETHDSHKWDAKYYKGLGTSKDSDARDYFSNMQKHMIPFATLEDGDKELIELAFSKKKADERKEWLRQFKPGTYLDHNMDEIPYSDFINKELILFSMADNIRSIPSVADGLKPGQRKVIWGCFKRKLKKEIKVAQLVGYISEHAAYHHGEQSLTSTIVNLAQDFVGTNNTNLLLPNGQYGTRDAGGKDHASARYIFTEFAPITRSIFHIHDDPILNYLTEDNSSIEPDYYVPVVPMVLLNGTEGIGTGWSTNVPAYNPVDIVANIRRLMKGEEQVEMMPWWRGFKGSIKKTGDHKYEVTGLIRKVNNTTVEITELPIHKWTQQYKAELEAMCGEKGDGVVKDYKEHHDTVNVHFVVSMAEKDLEKAEAQGLIEYFKLTAKFSTSNMICFDFDGKIKKYNSAEEIIEEFYPVRLAYYQKRKDYQAGQLELEYEKLTNQARFVQMIVKKELVISNRKKADIVAELRKKDFRPFPKVRKAKAAGETEEVVEEEEDANEPSAQADFDYLLGMAIWSLTQEKIEKLLEQGRAKKAELMELLERTPVEIWQQDLDNFLAEWERACEEWNDKLIKDSKGKVVKRKQATLKTRKSLTGAGKRRKGEDDDSEDDFKPTKAKAKAATKAIAPKPIEAKPSRPKPAAAPIDIDDDDDDDDYVKPAPPVKKSKADAGPSKPAAKRTALKMESDSEKDEPPKPPAKKKTGKRVDSDSDSGPSNIASKKKPVKKVESDSDDAFVAKAKGKAKAAPKRKSDEFEQDDSDDDLYTKPAKKRKPAEQPELTNFFKKDVAPKEKKPPSPSKVGGMKPRVMSQKKAVVKKVESDEEDSFMADSPPVKATAPKRAARAAPKKYVEVGSDDNENNADDTFEISD
ncbi:DNA topoisomerase II [Rickenella mellea]|uniref:DNA topoisomerase 2 n=1 Tax=Rickenella mellea TaxID=50990 RepID=A0A4Y7QMU9_9AGAM|nr:DNA topoisomerase II [Rickenella mellea]